MYDFVMKLHDDYGAIEFCDVQSIAQARDLWCRLAGNRGSRLIGFSVWADEGTFPVYEGDYVTDEC